MHKNQLFKCEPQSLRTLQKITFFEHFVMALDGSNQGRHYQGQSFPLLVNTKTYIKKMIQLGFLTII